MHLSAPNGLSVNDGINKDEFSLHYVTVDDAVRIIHRHGPGCLLAKADLKHAFRICPVNKSDWPLLGIHWQGLFYVDNILPFGLRSSPFLFNRLAEALAFITYHNFHVKDLLHYLDDYLLIQPSFSLSKAFTTFRTLLSVFTGLGIPLAEGDDKICPPSTVLTFLGIEFDTVCGELRLPAAKLGELKLELSAWLVKSSFSKRELLSLAGLLSFAAKVVPPSRTFVRRLFNAAADMTILDKQVTVPQEATEDIDWWSACCEEWNGRVLFIDPNWTQASKVSLWTDASGLGFGIVFGNERCCGTWSPEEEGYSIEWKELYPIVLAIAMWGSHLSGLRLTVRCDNEAVCHIWKSGTCKSRPIMTLLRAGLLIAAWYHAVVLLVPVPGVDNTLADCLSRMQVQRFMDRHPSATPIPRVPRHYLIQEFTRLHRTSYALAWRQVRSRLTPWLNANSNSLPP